ncbi:MAG: trigger factor [Candidatus Hydrogenedentota bacterium]
MSDTDKEAAENTTPEPEEAAATVAGAESAPEGADEQAFEFVEDPEFQVTYKGDCAYEVHVIIPEANVTKKTEELFEELKGEAEVPGFRRGKVPRKLLEKRFSKVVRGEVADSLVKAAFRKLMEDEDLHPLSMPDVEGLENVTEQDSRAPLEFTLKFEVMPRVELGEYKGIEVERPFVQVDEGDIDNMVNSLRENFSVHQPVEEPAQEGDQVIIDFHGTIAGEEFPGNAAQNYPYVLGTQRFFKEFEDVLNGARAGDEKTCEITFPDDYHSADLAGKTAEFTIKVNEVKRRELPEVNDEFAAQVGYETIEEMRKQIAGEMRERTKAASTEMVEQNAINKVIENSSFELPATLVEDSARQYYEQEVQRLRSSHVPGEQIEEREDELRAEARKNAENEIKGYFAMREIGRREGVEVTDADLEEEADSIVARTGAERDMVTRFLANEDQRSSYGDRIFRRKAMALIIDNANITERELTREEDEENNDTTEDA